MLESRDTVKHYHLKGRQGKRGRKGKQRGNREVGREPRENEQGGKNQERTFKIVLIFSKYKFNDRVSWLLFHKRITLFPKNLHSVLHMC